MVGRAHPAATRVTRPVPPGTLELRRAVESEHRTVRLGRLGRILAIEVDQYLEFFAIARSEPRSASRVSGRNRAQRARARGPSRA
jgi:hypothetical protein